jgi:hypothetical protein
MMKCMQEVQMDCSNKEGHYDWIVDFDSVKSAIENHVGPLFSCHRAMVSGCGTSLTSASLVECGVSEVVSVDIEIGCIEHMRRLYSEDRRLVWVHCDLNEISSIASCQDNGLRLASFDMIFDKGTLDAILVEGTISQYLANIYQLMAVHSCYVLISLHSFEFFLPILSSSLFGFEATHVQLHSGGSIIICKKNRNLTIDINALASLEEQVMNGHFKETNPLLQQSEVDLLIERFHGRALPLIDAYDIIFRERAYLGYTLELFMEDAAKFQLENEGFMTSGEAVEFIKVME